LGARMNDRRTTTVLDAVEVGTRERVPGAKVTTPPQPYPIDALGDVLAQAARAIAEKVQCAPAMAAQSVLSVASLAAQALVDVRLPYGQTRPVSLFCLTTAESGDRKTSADQEAMIPVRMREQKLSIEYKVRKEVYSIDHASWRAQRTQIERAKMERADRTAKLNDLGPEPEAPAKPILTINEGTAEGLAKVMPEIPGAVGIFSAEGGQFLSGYGFGAETKTRTAASFSGLWDGEPFRRARAGAGLIHLPGRRLACHLMIQPDAAQAVLTDSVLRDQGLLSRLLLAAPDSLAGHRTWREPTAVIEPALRRYIARVLAVFEAPQQAANAVGNELTPRTIEMSQSAREMWVGFHNEVERDMGKVARFSEMRDHASKAAEQAARIAGVLTMIDDPFAEEIGAEAMENGCELVRFYLSEALRLGNQYHVSQASLDADQIFNWILARGLTTVEAATLQKSGPNALRLKERMNPAVQELVDQGLLEPDKPHGKARSWRIKIP
jgi:hypothetical protein